MIHQMVTLEQYLSIATLWYKDNPTFTFQEYERQQDEINYQHEELPHAPSQVYEVDPSAF